MIAFDCADCGRQLQVQDHFAGQMGQCPSCGYQMEIPPISVQPEPGPLLTGLSKEASLFSLSPEPDYAEPESDAAPSRSEPEVESEREAVRNHSGGPLSEKDDFFVTPPPEIGQVLSATTTLTLGKEPMSPGGRFVVCLLLGGLGVGVGMFIVSFGVDPFWAWFWPILLGGLGWFLGYRLTRFSHTCTYIGELGLARFNCAGNREAIQGEAFLFTDATELRTAQTRHYHNGAYTHTDYSFTWRDAAGQTRFTIASSHKSEANTPGVKDLFYFAAAAEQVWSIYLLNQIQAQITSGGTIYFGLNGKNWIRLGEGKLILSQGGVEVECSAEELAGVRIDQGTVQIRRQDAQEGWFSSRGVYKFPYSSLGNAQLFMILMERLVGVRIN